MDTGTSRCTGREVLTPASQEHLLEVLRQIISFTEELNVDREDVWKVLVGVGSLDFGTVTASGLNRGEAASRQVWAATTLPGNAKNPVMRALLAVHGGLESALGTDELAQILAWATKFAGDTAEVV